MREMLFRGKNESGNWVYGSLIHVGKYCCILEEDDGSTYDYPYLDPKLGTIDGYATTIDPATICQYLGLTDINGTKIFEGDILESPDRRVGAKHGNLLIITDIRKCERIALYANDYCVIGNIYDNPELVEV